MSKNQQPDKLHELRNILIGAEKSQIEKIESEIANLKSSDVRAEALHEVIKKNIAKHPDAMGKEIYPAIEFGISKSIKSNPKMITNIISPVIGPAIRNAVSESMQSFVESTNAVIESSLSFDSMKWRLQSYLTGKSYSEIYLANTSEYYVEHIFLIQKKSGILIECVSPEIVGSVKKDEDVISGMLTAIRDFSNEAFNKTDTKSELNKIELNNRTILLENGPEAYLAFVVAGSPPRSIKRKIKTLVERVHMDFADSLSEKNFSSPKKQELVELLTTGLIKKDKENTIKNVEGDELKKRAAKAITYGLFALASILLISWAAYSFNQNWQQNKRIEEATVYIQKLNSQPGIAIYQHTFDDQNNLIIHGMKDFSVEVSQPLEQKMTKNIGSVKYVWKSYVSLDKEVLAARINKEMSVPKGTSFQLMGNSLIVQGDVNDLFKNKIKEIFDSPSSFLHVRFSEDAKMLSH